MNSLLHFDKFDAINLLENALRDNELTFQYVIENKDSKHYKNIYNVIDDNYDKLHIWGAFNSGFGFKKERKKIPTHDDVVDELTFQFRKRNTQLQTLLDNVRLTSSCSLTNEDVNFIRKYENFENNKCAL